jgi:hypothetical protein
MDMAGLLSAFSDLKFDGSDGDKDVQGVLETLMHQLMSKEILYEPLKELHEKVCAISLSLANVIKTFSVPGVFRKKQSLATNRGSSEIR